AAIEVQSKSIPTEGVSLLPELAKISSGDTLQFTATVTPQDATNTALNWSSIDPSLGTIQQDGLFIATASGTALEAQLTINEDTLALTLGEEVQLQASGQCVSSVIDSAQTVVSVSTEEGGFTATSELTVAFSTNQAHPFEQVVWSSQDENVVMVENGLVTAIGCGETSINVMTDCGLIGTVQVTVSRCGPRVTGVVVNPDQAVLSTGEQVLLEAVVIPSNAEDPSIIWVSGNDSIAKVSEDGLVTATATVGEREEPSLVLSEDSISLEVGTSAIISASGHRVETNTESRSTAITAISNDGSFMATATISVSFEKDTTIALSQFLWSSNDPSIVEVVDGELNALDCGSTTVVASALDGLLTKEVAVAVTACITPVTAVEIIASKDSLALGEELQLSSIVLPEDATDPSVIWSSANNTVVTVAPDGLITAVSPGTTTITLTSVEYPDVAAAREFTVQPPTQLYQAEDHTSRRGGSIATRFNGYTGRAYVDYGGNGTYVEWNNVQGYDVEVKLIFRYANGSSVDRTSNLRLNGEVVSILDFPTVTLGNWSSWGTIETTLTLPAGLNVVRVVANSDRGGPNLDRMEVGAWRSARTESGLSSTVATETFGTSVYPNPLNPGQALRVELGSSSEVELIDTTGRVLLQTHLPKGTHELQPPGLRKGIYIIRMRGSNSLQDFKILVR
ncbi:MAG: Ig-like domain-containing protein, partial [Bacteroidota bacterium]